MVIKIPSYIRDTTDFRGKAEWSRESITFLDTQVSLQEGHIKTDLYTKPTDTCQYLPPKVVTQIIVKEAFCTVRHSGYVEFAQSLKITNKEQQNYVAIWRTGVTMEIGCKSKLIEVNI